jgi:hypothetical protein
VILSLSADATKSSLKSDSLQHVRKGGPAFAAMLVRDGTITFRWTAPKGVFKGRPYGAPEGAP